MRHLDDGADATAFIAEHDRVEIVELDLGAGVRLVAALVLEPLQLQAVAEPSGSQPVARKQDRPLSVCASVRNRSLIGTEKNHLWPVSR